MRKTIISSLIIALIVATVFCCCGYSLSFTSSVPKIFKSCHETASSEKSNVQISSLNPQAQGACNCSQNVFLANKSPEPISFKMNHRGGILTFLIEEHKNGLLAFSKYQVDQCVPPDERSSVIPLYLKNPVLRI